MSAHSLSDPVENRWTAVPRDGGHATLPSDPPHRRSPAEALLWAVLIQALVDLGVGHLAGRPGKLVRTGAPTTRDARRWLLSPDRSHLCAFLSLCDAFGLDPTGLRQQVRAALAKTSTAAPVIQRSSNRPSVLHLRVS